MSFIRQMPSESIMSKQSTLSDVQRRTKKKEEKEYDTVEVELLNDTAGSSNKQLDFTTWIKENILKKECCFFERDPSKEEVCRCGYTEKEHTATASDFTDGTCKPEDRVQTFPTDAFGDINFGGVCQHTSKYVRVSADTAATVLYQLLTKQWELDPPNLLISVTGGANNFYLRSHLKKVFHRGLIKVAQTTGAWIITGGTNAGVMKHVGLAVKEYALSNSMQKQVVVIGVAPWGVIHNRKSLKNEEGYFQTHYEIDKQGQGDLTCLDDNHTHFLLVDDGTNGHYSVEIPLRTKLEQYISDQTIDNKESGIKIPVVCVVLDGGLGTLRNVYHAIIEKTPCVILQGSGRIADVIAHVFQQHKHSNINDLIHEQMKKFFSEDFKKLTPCDIEECKNMIQEIIKKSDLLTIFRARKDDKGALDVAILDALFKALRTAESQEEHSWKKQLELAITWNRAKSAETEIFTEASQWKSDDLHWAMKLALVDNKPNFVSLLLENGVILKDFLKDDDTICELYKKLPKCFFLYKLVKRVELFANAGKFHLSSAWGRQGISRNALEQARQKISLDYVSDEVRHLLGKFTKHLYRPSPMCGGHTVSTEDMSCGWKPEAHMDDTAKKKGKDQREKEVQRDAARDLFLWAVVHNNKEVAEIAWEECRDCISAALAACKILKKMAEESIDADQPQEMLELASHYEDHAIGVFSDCYKNDEERAQKLLIRISRLWGETTCLRLALEADNKNFVAQSGVQDLLTQIWCGELSDNNPVWRVLVCMVFFPLICTRFLVFRCDEVLQREIEQNEEIKKTGTKESKSTLNNNSNCFKVNLEPLDFWFRLVGLYGSPQVKFYGNIISYFAFLFLFAYVLMIDFQSTPSVVELVLYFWLFTLVCEEIRQLFYDPDHFGFCEKAKMYICELWNILDVLSILGFCLGLVFRLTTKLFYQGKTILCIDFVVFCLRLMAIFTINRTLGPKIIIVKKMMKDMFFFMFLLSIWVMAYGVAKQGILIHNDNRLDWIIRGAVYEPYLVIFGNFPENIDNAAFDINSCSMNGTDPLKPKCPVLNENQMPVFPEWLTIVMLCVYLLFANILLLNLLIAIFNYTFEEVHDNTDRIWKFQRYQLIKEYYSRPAPPPPFIILTHLYLFIKAVVLWKSPEAQSEFKKEFTPKEEVDLLSWEALIKDRYLFSAQRAQRQSMEGRIQDTSKKITTLLTEQLKMKEEKNFNALLRRHQTLERQVTQSNTLLQMSVDSLKSQDDSAKETVKVANLSERLEREEEESFKALLRRMEKLEGQVTNALQRIEDSLKSLGAPAKETQPQSTVE